MTDLGLGDRPAFLDVRFDRFDEDRVLSQLSQITNEQTFAFVVTPNVDHIVRLHSSDRDPVLWQAYRSAFLCLCDSQILRFLARCSGIPLPLVAGSNLTAHILKDERFKSRAFAVIGGDRDLLDRLEAGDPERRWYHHAPPMGIRTDRQAQLALIDFVENCPADIHFFAIGSPQSELLCGELCKRGKARGVALCIGASLEFVTGTKARAPRWMQRFGLEWLFRLLSEPRRLWRRYLIEGPAIFQIWWRWRFSADRHCAACDSSSLDEK
jgi:N-acetylglucosaminyldiphosphoundecaprenol N-acetyl-beta-D-mannosaminyltransferase